MSSVAKILQKFNKRGESELSPSLDDSNKSGTSGTKSGKKSGKRKKTEKDEDDYSENNSDSNDSQENFNMETSDEGVRKESLRKKANRAIADNRRGTFCRVVRVTKLGTESSEPKIVSMRTKSAIAQLPLKLRPVLYKEFVGSDYDYTKGQIELQKILTKYECHSFSNQKSWQYYGLLERLNADHTCVVNVIDGSIFDNERKMIMQGGLVVQYSIPNSMRFHLIVLMLGKLIEFSEKNLLITLRELYYYLRALIIQYYPDKSHETLQTLQNFINTWINIIFNCLQIPIYNIYVLAGASLTITGHFILRRYGNLIYEQNCGEMLPPNASDVDIQSYEWGINSINGIEFNSNCKLIIEYESDALLSKIKSFVRKYTTNVLWLGVHGVSNKACRPIVRKIAAQLKIPYLILSDFDPYSFREFFNRRYGYENCPKNSMYTSIPHARKMLTFKGIEWLIENTKGTNWKQNFLEPLSDNCSELLTELIQQPYIEDDMLEDLQSMNVNQVRLQISNIPHELFDEFVMFSIKMVDPGDQTDIHALKDFNFDLIMRLGGEDELPDEKFTAETIKLDMAKLSISQEIRDLNLSKLPE